MTAISHYNQQFSQVDAFFSSIEKRLDDEKTGIKLLKAYSFSMTVLQKRPDGKWISFKCITGEFEAEGIAFKLPATNKKLYPFLLNIYSKSPDQKSRELGQKMLNSFRPNSKACNDWLDNYRKRSAEQKTDRRVQNLIKKVKSDILKKLDQFSGERIVTKLHVDAKVYEDIDKKKVESYPFNIHFHNQCEECKGWKTTAAKVKDCSTCLAEIPQPIEHNEHDWDTHDILGDPSVASSSSSHL